MGSPAGTTKMKTDLNIKISLTGQQTDRSHWPDETIPPRSFPGEGNALLSPSENFACFKCNSTGQWRSVSAAKLRELSGRLAALNSFSEQSFS